MRDSSCHPFYARLNAILDAYAAHRTIGIASTAVAVACHPRTVEFLR